MPWSSLSFFLLFEARHELMRLSEESAFFFQLQEYEKPTFKTLNRRVQVTSDIFILVDLDVVVYLNFSGDIQKIGQLYV